MPYGYRDVLGTVGLIRLDQRRFTITVLEPASGATQLELSGLDRERSPEARVQPAGADSTGGQDR
ncbi:hypothetical protein [Actinomadura sp. 3N508]|uniref:hypothetical protein n=1 Tax=Actinomadura sp. 3N508 TaxID=3375153 RepID=UPI00378B6529